jgi:hypothetical protein
MPVSNLRIIESREHDMSAGEGDDGTDLYTDGRGIPTLTDVVVPGDRMRAAGYRLFGGASQAAVDASEADGDGDARSYLEERIRRAIETALPAAMERALEDLPGLMKAGREENAANEDDRG